MTRTDRHDRHDRSVRAPGASSVTTAADTAGAATHGDVADLPHTTVVTAYAITGNGCFTLGSSGRSPTAGSTGAAPAAAIDDTAANATDTASGETARRRPMNTGGRIVGAAFGMHPDAYGHTIFDAAAPRATVHSSKAIPRNCAAEAEKARVRQ
ncbi:hypothetical protein [Streptomyces sp. NPDC050263]|uniref:hypothetical protein n=1 Tax=Streptomyces sp. NPDC050263 TaxID=3155037 RepID=UPI00341751BA